jgi:cephalosporin-C deacetylase-like acetyl esterase
MRSLLFLPALLVVFFANGQEQYKVFSWRSEQTFNTYLLQQVHQQYDLRRDRLSKAVKSPSGVTAYSNNSKEQYRKLLGAMPSHTELNVTMTGIIERKGYRIEKVIYESVPGHHVTSNLYVPEGKGPFPAVLLFCGHEAESKATISYQKTAILFAQHGFVVFVIDPISQGERYQLTDATGKPLTRGGTTEHTLVNAAANLVGSGAVAYELWDNVRGLDYLETRPEVDKNRIGCVGNSGGGTQVVYFIGFDDRIKIAAPCSYIASRERNFDLIGANDGCQHVMGEGEAKLEIADFLIMFAPKPMLVLAGRYDFVDYTGTLQAYREVKDAYRAFDQKEKVKLFTVDDGHGISKPKREATVTWFRKWLYNDSTAVKEGEIETLSAKELQCTVTGQVNSSYPDEVNDLKRVLQTAEMLAQQRQRKSTDIKTSVAALMNIQADRKTVSAEHTGRIEHEGYTIDKIILRQEGGMVVPALVIYPEGVAKQIVLLLHDQGKHRFADSTALINEYLAQHSAIVMADLAGLGEMTDPVTMNDAKYYNREYRNAMAALHAGSSLPAARTQNIITLLDFIRDDKKMQGAPVTLVATGRAALPALHAAVADKRISKLKVNDLLSSFEEIVKDPTVRDWYSYIIPGVLNYYDVADLKRVVADRLLK